MRPAPRSRMVGSAACIIRSGPRTLVVSTCSTRLAGTASTGPLTVIAALLMTTSSAPAAAIASSIDAGSVRSRTSRSETEGRPCRQAGGRSRDHLVVSPAQLVDQGAAQSTGCAGHQDPSRPLLPTLRPRSGQATACGGYTPPPDGSPAQAEVGQCGDCARGERCVHVLSDPSGCLAGPRTGRWRWARRRRAWPPRTPTLPGIVLTALPGQPAHDVADDTQDAAGAHRQAGALLRRLHDAEPTQPLPQFARRLTECLGWWLTQTSEGELANRGAHAVAERLETTPITFPGGHAGSLGGEYGQMGEPEAFAARLREVLAA